MLAYPTLLSQSYRRAILNTYGLMAYWRLSEASGTVASDELGTYNGTYVATPTLGVAGTLAGDLNTGATFNGSSQYVTCPSINLQQARGISVAAWVNIAAFSTNGGGAYLSTIWGFETGGSTSCYFGDGTLGGNNKMILTLGGSNLTLTTTATTATKYFVVGTTNLTTTRLYRDGVELTSNAFSGALANGAGRLASTSAAGGRELNGTIDEVSIWSRPLTADEIARLYRIGRGF